LCNSDVMKIITFFIAGFLAINLCMVSCAQAPQRESNSKIGVIVSILPQEEFVRSVGGNMVNVTVMVPPGANPHTYEVIPAQMVQLSGAKIYAKVGSPLEFELTWLDKLIAQNRDMLVVDCRKGIELMQSTDPDEPGIDSHIWTSVRNVKIMVGNICDGLSKVDPSNRQYYERNRDDYLMKLDSLDSDIKSTLAGAADRTFIVYHPAWGYFARDYGLKQLGIEREGKEPQAAYMARLINQAKTSNIKIIFVSPEFDTRSAEAIAHEIGGSVVAISDLSPHYLENMRNVAQALKGAFK
jgi:zinc transport system substrate-binding protein